MAVQAISGALGVSSGDDDFVDVDINRIVDTSLAIKGAFPAFEDIDPSLVLLGCNTCFRNYLFLAYTYLSRRFVFGSSADVELRSTSTCCTCACCARLHV